MSVGLLSTVNILQDLQEVSFAQAIMRLMPNGSAPLVALTGLLKEETATNIEHGYFSKTMVFPSGTANAHLIGDTVITFSSGGTHIAVGDLLLNENTNEIMLVTAVTSPTAITVQRAAGSTAAAAIGAGNNLRTVGNAFEQGSNRPAAINILATRHVNNTQIFRNSWAVTKTAASIPQIAGLGQVAENKQDCAALHATAMEKALFFGERFMGTRLGQPFHTMEGIIPRVRAAASGNVTLLGATTNWTQLEAAIDPVFQTVSDPRSGNIRTAFVGGTAMRVMTNIARLNSNYQLIPEKTSWGMRISSFQTPRGVIELIEHPLFNAYGPLSPWSRMAVIVDLNAFSIAYLRKTSEDNYNARGVQVDNGIDAEGGTLTTEMTCSIKNPAAFGFIHNFTAAAAG